MIPSLGKSPHLPVGKLCVIQQSVKYTQFVQLRVEAVHGGRAILAIQRLRGVAVAWRGVAVAWRGVAVAWRGGGGGGGY